MTTHGETNGRLRSRLEELQVKLIRLERERDDLEAQHNQCPFWIQKNENLVEVLQEHCESLEQDKKRLEQRCDRLESHLLISREHSNAAIKTVHGRGSERGRASGVSDVFD